MTRLRLELYQIPDCAAWPNISKGFVAKTEEKYSWNNISTMPLAAVKQNGSEIPLCHAEGSAVNGGGGKMNVICVKERYEGAELVLLGSAEVAGVASRGGGFWCDLARCQRAAYSACRSGIPLLYLLPLLLLSICG